MLQDSHWLTSASRRSAANMLLSMILSSCAYLCRRAVWVIGHAATLERSPPWKAFMDHTHQQKTHFVVPRRAGELLKMSRQQLQETLTS